MESSFPDISQVMGNNIISICMEETDNCRTPFNNVFTLINFHCFGDFILVIISKEIRLTILSYVGFIKDIVSNFRNFITITKECFF